MCLFFSRPRTQRQNRSQALNKLKEMVEEAWEPAKERKLRTGISKTGKEIRKADKRHRSQVRAFTFFSSMINGMVYPLTLCIS